MGLRLLHIALLGQQELVQFDETYAATDNSKSFQASKHATLFLLSSEARDDSVEGGCIRGVYS